jgi:fluoride exporter
MKFFLPFLLVGVGGFAGSILRYLMTLLFRNYHTMPFGTLVSNVAGCFFIGIITGLSIDAPILSAEARLFLATGMCGGFTTLSSFIFELGQFAREGEYLIGSMYFTGTIGGAGLAFLLGTLLPKILIKG